MTLARGSESHAVRADGLLLDVSCLTGDDSKVKGENAAGAAVGVTGDKVLTAVARGKEVTVKGAKVGNSAKETVKSVNGGGGGCFDLVTVGVKDTLKSDDVSVVVKSTAEGPVEQTAHPPLT